MFIRGWKNEENVVYTYNEKLRSLREKEILPLVTIRMDPVDTMLNEIKQTMKEYYNNLTYVYKLK